MAKVTAYIPEPKQEYEVENQRQILVVRGRPPEGVYI